MLLREVGSSDSRFKRLRFHEGMNLLLADKTEESSTGDSRNGAGKTSLILILRHLLGGDSTRLPTVLADHVFWGELDAPDQRGSTRLTRVERFVRGGKVTVGGVPLSLSEWKAEVGAWFGLDQEVRRPTVGQLMGQLVRTDFRDAVKTHNAESDVESGIRIGYLLGLSPEILGKAAEVATRDKHDQAVAKAVKAGTIPGADVRVSGLRSELARAKTRRDRVHKDLDGFRVDVQYAEHQAEADRLTRQIRDLNDEAAALEQRRGDLNSAMAAEKPAAEPDQAIRRLEVLYEEVGVVLPDLVGKRFDEVADFHASVIQNRQSYLESELRSVNDRLSAIATDRAKLDLERASVMTLLNDSMALDTFRDAERELTELNSAVADLERRLEQAQAMESNKLKLRSMMIEAESGVQTEIRERAAYLDEAIALFVQLGEEIYADRSVGLLIDTTSRGVLKVSPKIDGDASTGISEVKTFLLDLVCLVTAIKAGRAPKLLVHDSLLFDSMDERQMASCLNIGARLADEHQFQYLVTLNSDRLEAAEKAGFDLRDHVLSPKLTDYGEDGGLFGFRFV
ncbi:MAG: DUF2326 domain-containing protein [Propionibacteriaceae bacterium]|jgi:uncharacterized protein YydD (DUF2326 family)|nr:DUF2326 domain-containing protein [Propionibacteriaceae bacterium]